MKPLVTCTSFEAGIVRRGTEIGSLRSRISLAVLAAAALVYAAAIASVRAAPGVEPQTVNETVKAGECVTITKVVHTPPIPPKPDIVFLADNTGSMGPAIANVQANAATILAAVDAADPDSQFGVALYTDFDCTDPFPYLLQQPITADNTAVINAINAWAAGDGCDVPEAQLNALFELATTGAGYRTGSTKIIVWFGDSSGHDPSNGHTLTDVINALVAAGIRVIAVPVSTAGDGLDSTGQATAITTATGGVLLPSATPDQVSAAIIAGLGNLPVAVSPQVGTCDSSLTVTFDTASQTVISGNDATFAETICVAAAASQCGSVNCQVNWLLDGNPVTLPDGSVDPAFVQSITIAVPDVTAPTITCPANITQCNDPTLCSAVVTFTPQAEDNCGVQSLVCAPASGSTFPKGATTVTCTATDTSGNTATCSFGVTVNDCEAPVADCIPTTNTAGGTVPPATNTNPDGFYQVVAKDNCDATASLQIFVKDSIEGPCGGTFAAGPYASGTKLKLTQMGDNGRMASVKPMAGVIVAHIQTIGDPVLVVTDSSGNQVCHLCLVPKPPK